MAKNKKEKNYYNLHTEAVDRLVNTNEKNAPEVSEEEIAKFRGKKKYKIPNLLKVLFIKWWFTGAICFFFFLGLGTYVTNTIDQLFILGAALGILTDLLTNHMLRFVETSVGSNDKYMMVTVRKYWSMFLNFPYSFVVLYFVVYIYNIINYVLLQIFPDGSVFLPVEPVLMGLFYLMVDMLFIGMKHLLKKIVQDAVAQKK